MIKNLRYFTDDAILFFKANPELICEKMRENPGNTDWIDGVFKNATVASKYSWDFDFPEYDGSVSNKQDFELAKSIYELFRDNGIGPAIVYSEKFITGFIFSFGYKYFMQSVGANEQSHVFGMLFYDEGVRRATTRNIITRLYRYVEQTVEEEAEDQYELTRFVFDNTALYRLTYYPKFDGEQTHKAFYKAFKEWHEETGKPIRVSANKVMDHLSILCNVNDTDLMSEREVIDYVKEFIYKIDRSK